MNILLISPLTNTVKESQRHFSKQESFFDTDPFVLIKNTINEKRRHILEQEGVIYTGTAFGESFKKSSLAIDSIWYEIWLYRSQMHTSEEYHQIESMKLIIKRTNGKEFELLWDELPFLRHIDMLELAKQEPILRFHLNEQIDSCLSK